MKVNLKHKPLKLHQYLGEVLKRAVQTYGEVLQVRKYTNSYRRIFREASIILNRDEDTKQDYAEMARIVYLEGPRHVYLWHLTKSHPDMLSLPNCGPCP
jgi:hypothetical protein